MDFSLVIPVYNEEENLKILIEKIKEAVDPLKKNYEIIFINDGSTDNSNEILINLAKDDSSIKLINFTKNFGQTPAMVAGIDNAKGEIIIPMDADLQNDPLDIPVLLEKMKEGFDVVSGWRKNRKDKSFTRVLPSKIANWLISIISGVKLHDYGCTLKAYRKDLLKSIKLYGEMHRFIPAYASWEGGKVTEIVVKHHPRIYGKSKYNLSRVSKVILDLLVVRFLVSYSTKPIYFFGNIGLIMILLGILSGVEVIIEKWLIGTFAHRNPFLNLAVFLFLIGLQLILMGLLAEIGIRTYHESQDKSIYSIKNKVNL